MRAHMDGARFANAVVSLDASPAEVTWRAGVDVLSFGATKNGALTADAIVVFDRSYTEELSFRVKRAGQLSSRMRFQSAQLKAYLADDLWLHNATHANAMAAELAEGIDSTPGISLLNQPQANIVFCRLPQAAIDALLADGYEFYHDRWEPGVVRFVTSFMTSSEEVSGLISSLRDHSLLQG
nr:beta-eliminating lyase-related protein [Corynebacterium sp. J010B-136]